MLLLTTSHLQKIFACMSSSGHAPFQFITSIPDLAHNPSYCTNELGLRARTGIECKRGVSRWSHACKILRGRCGQEETVSIMRVKLAMGSCPEQKSSICPHQSKINNQWNGGHSLAGGEAVRVVDCVEVDLLHPRRKWVVWSLWGCDGMPLTSLCAFWCCPACAVL